MLLLPPVRVFSDYRTSFGTGCAEAVRTPKRGVREMRKRIVCLFVCIFVSLLGKGLFDTKSLCSCIIDTWEENTKVYLFYYLSNQVLNKVFSYF